MSEELIKRLLEHAAMHEQYIPFDDEQAQFAKDLREAAAALSRPAPAVQVPDGMALVPVEPTQEMLAAAAPFPEHLRLRHPDDKTWEARMQAATAGDQMVAAQTYRKMLAAAPTPATVAPNSNLYGPGSATSPAAAHMLATGAFPAPVATDAVAQEEASNEQIREMALDRLHAIPRVMRHENGSYYTHPDGKLFYADITIQMAMDIVDDVILACAATWSAATPAEQAVGDLLAVIHGDGGHYQAEHGTEKAARDAISKYNELRATLAYMGSPFEAGAQGVDVEKVMALVEEYGDLKFDSGAYNGSTWASKRAEESREQALDKFLEIRALLSASPAGVGGYVSAGVVINNNQPGSQYIVEAHHGQTVCVGAEVFIK